MFEGSIWIFRGVDPVVLFTIFAKFKLAMSYRTPQKIDYILQF